MGEVEYWWRCPECIHLKTYMELGGGKHFCNRHHRNAEPVAILPKADYEYMDKVMHVKEKLDDALALMLKKARILDEMMGGTFFDEDASPDNQHYMDYFTKLIKKRLK